MSREREKEREREIEIEGMKYSRREEKEENNISAKERMNECWSERGRKLARQG